MKLDYVFNFYTFSGQNNLEEQRHEGKHFFSSITHADL